jgi:nicotinate-nucleotide adenylyltransferase
MNVAFYGGSFNPPHVAHVLAVAYLRAVAGFDRVVVVPVFAHAFDKQLVDFEHRVRMCELAIEPFSCVEVSREEESLEVPSLTIRTLDSLRRKHPNWQLRLVIGADVLYEARRWHAFEQVTQLAPPYVLGRSGVQHPDAPAAVLPDISSTRVRELLAGRSVPRVRAELERYVPRRVLEYIDGNALYSVA